METFYCLEYLIITHCEVKTVDYALHWPLVYFGLLNNFGAYTYVLTYIVDMHNK